MCNNYWNLYIYSHDCNPHFVECIASKRSKTGLPCPIPKEVPRKLKTECGECLTEKMDEDKEGNDAKGKRVRVAKKEAEEKRQRT